MLHFTRSSQARIRRHNQHGCITLVLSRDGREVDSYAVPTERTIPKIHAPIIRRVRNGDQACSVCTPPSVMIKSNAMSWGCGKIVARRADWNPTPMVKGRGFSAAKVRSKYPPP